MTRDEFLKTIRSMDGTRKVLVLKNGKRLRLRARQECCASFELIIAPDRKKFHVIQYADIRELRPLGVTKRRRKAN